MRARWVLVLLVLAPLACADLNINPEYGSIQEVILDPSFRGDIMPVLRQTCGSSGACHGGANPQQGLKLDDDSLAYVTLVNVVSSAVQAGNMLRVTPGDTANSFMYRVLSLNRTFRLDYYRMPLTEYALPDETRLTIAHWILDGAPYN